MSAPSDAAAAALAMESEDGPGAPASSAFAPGRCTVVGEHVDYADGVVVCAAVQLGVGVAARESRDGRWHMRSEGRSVSRDAPLAAHRAGDIADLPLATVLALRQRGIAVPPLEMRVVATLPEGAGLSSSAALCGATAVAVLRHARAALSGAELAAAMLRAERDILGIPCGPLDQRAVVDAPRDGVLVLECRDGSSSPAPWLADHVLVACHTGDAHDVGGAGYRSRRAEADGALRMLGAASYRDVDMSAVEALSDGTLRRRARHIVSETRRARDCAEAVRRGDAAGVGRLMSASHASLRDDYAVSTAALDTAVAAAEAVDGCLGARLCGAGFGGTAIALVERGRASACVAAMQAALGNGVARRGTWLLEPSPGLRVLAPDVVSGP